MSVKDEAKGVLAARALSYQRVFLGKGVDTDRVLVDLARFCRASQSTFHPDARLAAQLDGRREVYLRICQHLKLTEDQLWSLYGNHSLSED